MTFFSTEYFHKVLVPVHSFVSPFKTGFIAEDHQGALQVLLVPSLGQPILPDHPGMSAPFNPLSARQHVLQKQ